MSASLRRHLRERHGRLFRGVPRSNAACEAQHASEHHRLSLSHHHGPTSGPDDRPPGWTTGEDVEEHKGPFGPLS